MSETATKFANLNVHEIIMRVESVRAPLKHEYARASRDLRVWGSFSRRAALYTDTSSKRHAYLIDIAPTNHLS